MYSFCSSFKRNRPFVRVTVGLLLFCFLLTTGALHPIPADCANPKKKLKEIKKKLLREEKKIEETKKKEASILTELEKIDKSVQKKKSEMRYFDNRLSQNKAQMKILKKDIASLTEKLDYRKDLLMKRLRVLYKEQHGGDTALILISAKNYQDLLKISRNISLLAHYDSNLMKTYSDGIQNYDNKKQQMENLQKELEKNKENIRNRLKDMSTERHKKDSILASVKSERDSYEKMARELKNSSVRLNKMIKELEKKQVPPSVSGSGFRSMKGRLPWPVYGTVLVPFGKYKDPKFNIPVFKNGIEIKAVKGSSAKAVHGGRVVYADWFKGYGQIIIINHGKGYHSLYGHLSEIFYKAGDIIKNGRPVGTVVETGTLNIPTLYFELRYKGKPIDPLGWLQHKKKATKQKKRTAKKKLKKRKGR